MFFMRLSKSALVGWRWRPLRYSRSMKRIFLPVLLLFSQISLLWRFEFVQY
jgi:hypothetical protein